MRGRFALLVVLWTSSLAGQPVVDIAGDIWLEVDSYRVDPNRLVEIRSGGGAIFAKPRQVVSLNRISSRLSIGPLGSRVRLGRVRGEETWLIQEFTPPHAGNYWIAFSSGPTRVDLSPAQLNQYLRVLGFSRKLQQRRRNGIADQGGVEESRRYAKIYLQVGDLRSPNADQPIGQTLEILLLDNPYAGARKGRIRVKVLFQGRPLSDFRIHAGRRDQEKATFSRTTDSTGRTSLPIGDSGDWYLRGVHLLHGLEKGAPYLSFWASVTFSTTPARSQ